jgi:hypothetical protein
VKRSFPDYSHRINLIVTNAKQEEGENHENKFVLFAFGHHGAGNVRSYVFLHAKHLADRKKQIKKGVTIALNIQIPILEVITYTRYIVYGGVCA